MLELITHLHALSLDFAMIFHNDFCESVNKLNHPVIWERFRQTSVTRILQHCPLSLLAFKLKIGVFGHKKINKENVLKMSLEGPQ